MSIFFYSFLMKNCISLPFSTLLRKKNNALITESRRYLLFSQTSYSSQT